MARKTLLIAAVTLLLVATSAIAACGVEQEQAPDENAGAPEETTAQRTQAAGEETRVLEETTAGVTTPEETTTDVTTAEGASDVVSVGGFSVERPDGGETTLPQVSAQRQDVQSYRAQVEPVIEDTIRDLSDLVQADVSLENGNLSFDVERVSLQEARESVRDGLEQLRQIAPPEDLEPIHRRLIEAYERVLPAYAEIIDAVDSGDPQRTSVAVRENLPRLETFNEETSAILQDLEQAAGSQQQ